ncbi:hypothetical protein MPSEU_000999500 [Mayamaea pseudoterrestris]|nr:hypothetical protein MPSEU_000999500 [Mayamaea pseudoterrestris]
MKRFLKNLTGKSDGSKNGNHKHPQYPSQQNYHQPQNSHQQQQSPPRSYGASQGQQEQQTEENITYLYPNHIAPAVLQAQQQQPLPPPQSQPSPPRASPPRPTNGSKSRVVTTTVQRVPPPPKQTSLVAANDASSPSRAVTNYQHTNTPTTPNSAATPEQQQQEDSPFNDSTRNLVKRFIADVWNRGEIDVIPDVCSPQLRFNGNAGFDRIGHDGLARMVATIRGALDDYHCEIHSMVVEHNKAFCRLRFTGKHVGTLLGYEPTRKVVAWMGATEFTCLNGKILKVWELGDMKSLEEQLMPDHDRDARNGTGADGMEI